MNRTVSQPTVASRLKAKSSHDSDPLSLPASQRKAGTTRTRTTTTTTTTPRHNLPASASDVASDLPHHRNPSSTCESWALSEDGDRLRRVSYDESIGSKVVYMAHICSIGSSWEPVRFDPDDLALFFVPDDVPSPKSTVVDLGVESSIPKDAFTYLGLLGRRLVSLDFDRADITSGTVSQVEVERGIKYLCDLWADDEGLFVDHRHIPSKKDPIPWRAQVLQPRRFRGDVSSALAYDVGPAIRRIKPPSKYPSPPSSQESVGSGSEKIKYSLRSSSILPARGNAPPMLCTNLRAFAPLESFEAFDGLRNSASNEVDTASTSVLTGEAAIQRYNQLILALYSPSVHAAGIIVQKPRIESTDKEFSQTLVANFKSACEGMGFTPY